MAYVRFVGDREAEGQALQADGPRRRRWWHVHLAWVLECRAIQDVPITPVRSGPYLGDSEPRGPYSEHSGTTLRIYDPERDCWDVTWLDPITRFKAHLAGRTQADGSIIQEGRVSNGTGLRRVFSDVHADSFRWHWKCPWTKAGIGTCFWNLRRDA